MPRNLASVQVQVRYTSMDLQTKVALITGGASGIGKSFATEFLENGIRGVTIADINEVLGETTTKELKAKFGNDKVIFVKTDVSNEESFKNAFEKTLEKYGNIDILVNNAGVFNEVNWRLAIQVNLVGTTIGMILGVEHYLPKYKSGEKAFIVNIASVGGYIPVPYAPVYVATKHGIVGLTRSYGINKHVYNDGICVIALCPSATSTPMADYKTNLVRYQDLYDEMYGYFENQMQSPDAVAKAAMQAMEDGDSGSAWVVQRGETHKINFPNETLT